MYSKHGNKLMTCFLLLAVVVSLLAPMATAQAAGLGSVLAAAASPTAPANGSGLLNALFSLVFDKILGPLFNIFGGNTSAHSNPSASLPPAPSGGGPLAGGALRGKVIVVDPGHGGDNPGAVDNNTREADVNLAVALKLRDRLRQAGATVLMTRDSDRNVAPVGSPLSQELQARVDVAENNRADIFVSLHSNENSDSSITGATTYYPRGKSSALAREVQKAVVRETGEADKGAQPEGFYVLRNITMPGILVEMGFLSNAGEAAKLRSDSYRSRIAQGVFDGIADYFQQS